jgi:streptogramin lyase
LLAILILVLLVREVSPAAVGVLSEYTSPSYYRVEAVYLLPPLVFLFLVSLMGFSAYLSRLRPMLGFGLASVGFATVIAVLVTDSNTDFTTEACKITIFTTTVLVLCGLASGLNYLSWTYAAERARWRRGFWALLTFAFLFAAADEALMIHERLGQALSGGGGAAEGSNLSAQDEITLFYAVAALAVLSAAGLAISAARGARQPIVVLMAGALTYFASTILDSADASLRTPALGLIDLRHMANSTEEILEFAAACLFLFGAVLAFLEAPQNAAFTRTLEGRVARWRGRWLQIGVAACLVAFLAAAGAATLFYPPRAANDVVAQTVTGADGAALHPDGMTSRGGRIYIVNDAPPLITVLDPATGHRTLFPVKDQVGSLESIAVGPDGRIYFSDDSANTVSMVDPDQHGRVTALLGPKDGLRSPKGLAIGPSGDLYIADVGASAILRYSVGRPLSVYASAIDGVDVPEELAFDSMGNLYVTEDQKRVLKIRPDRTSSLFLGEAQDFTPEAIAIRDDRIYVTDSVRRAITEYDLSGRGRVLAAFPNRLGRMLEGVAVADNGDVWAGLRPSHGIPGAVIRIRKHAD